jgi:phosphate transport system ATP-binding protein
MEQQLTHPAALNIVDLSTYYHQQTALHHLSFEAPAQAITVIIGPSGCGKSTLLKTINRTIEDEEDTRWDGTVALFGDDTKRMSKEEVHTKIGLVFQTPAPFPFSIYRNMTYALAYHGMHDKQQQRSIIDEKLSIVGLYDEVHDRLKESACALSGGQQQRLCIARALTVNPDVLMLDEPCSALDSKSTHAIEQTLKTLAKTTTIVLVTHNIGQARRLADKVIYLSDGSIVEQGSAQQMFTQPRDPRTVEFIDGIGNAV